MSRFIPDEIIDQILNRVHIVDLIGSYIPLKKAGKNFNALCPFHNEKTPSFIVNPERNSFHCFGCGKGGNIFRFVMEKEGVDFPNAAHLIADKYHIHIPEAPVGQYNNPQKSAQLSNQRDRLYKLYDTVCSFYQRQLNTPGNPVLNYLNQRLIPTEISQEFRLGASPDSWDATLNYCRSQGFTEKELFTADLVKQSDKNQNHYYDTFRNRLMFPIWNEQGKVVAFSGRTLEADAKSFKYVNSGETPVFTKSRILYALPLARQAINQMGYAILCEGQLDVIAMHRAGFKNAVAPQGTAFTDEQARIIKRYTDRLYLAFDSDSAGLKAIIRAFDIAVPVGLEVRAITFPQGSDPDDIFKQRGPAGIKQLVDQSQDFLEFILNVNLPNINADSSWDVTRFISEILDHVSKIENSITRASYCAKISQRFNIAENAIFNELNKRRKQDAFKSPRQAPLQQMQMQQQQMQQQTSIEAFEKTTLPHTNSIIQKAEETLLESALAHGTVGHRLVDELPAGMISKTPIGKALEDVIKYTLDGEWENSSKYLSQQLNQSPNPDPEISRILAKPNELNHEQQEKAVTDCVKVIKSFYIKQDIEKYQNQLKSAQTDDERAIARDNYLKKRAELRQVMAKR